MIMSSSQEIVEEHPLPPVFSELSNLLDDHLESFASGNNQLQLAALNATKYVFDHALTTESKSRPHIVDLLSSLHPAEAPRTRSQTRANGKRKRSPPPLPPFKETPLSSLYVQNVDPEQVWAQLELRTQGICDMLQKALDGTSDLLIDEDDENSDDKHRSGKKQKFADLTPGDLAELGIDAETLEALAQEEDDEEDYSDETDSEEEQENDDDGDDEEVDLGEEVTELRDPDEIEQGKSTAKATKPPKLSGGGHSTLDDGFFNLASFNAETEEAEAKTVSRGRLGKSLEDEDTESDAESIDYFAPVDNVEALDEEDLEATEPEAFYKDFFDPPAGVTPSKPKSPTKSNSTKVRFHEEVKVKNIKAKGKQLPVNATYYWDEEDDRNDDFGKDMVVDGEVECEDVDGQDGEEDNLDGEQSECHDEGDDGDVEEFGGGRKAIERLEDDLFNNGDEPETDTTTHQKRIASLQEQIAALEAENIAPKNWTLMGEAHARGRPQNSLLEEDLEFDRVMKVVPMVTEDSVQELEERIKARIVDNNFDDVVRRRPLDEKPFLPSRIIQLQDSKSAQSLAEIYEGEYVAAQTGSITGGDRDGKLKKEQTEIERLWENISNKLDALCNAHFMPKQPKATIINISDTAAATLESALPTTHTVSTMLAPEEILEPSSSNGPRVRSELTPAEKRALRSKERKMRKKTRDQLEKSVNKFSSVKGVKRQKEEALKKVVKNGRGVTVVGKKSKEILGRGRKKV